MVGAIKFKPDPLLKKQGSSLLKNFILIILTVMVVACCITKCQEVPIRLAQYFLLIFTPNPKQEFHAISSCYSLVCLVSHSQIYVIHIFTERILKHFLNFYQYNKKTHNQKGNKNSIKTECCKLGA